MTSCAGCCTWPPRGLRPLVSGCRPTRRRGRSNRSSRVHCAADRGVRSRKPDLDRVNGKRRWMSLRIHPATGRSICRRRLAPGAARRRLATPDGCRATAVTDRREDRPGIEPRRGVRLPSRSSHRLVGTLVHRRFSTAPARPIRRLRWHNRPRPFAKRGARRRRPGGRAAAELFTRPRLGRRAEDCRPAGSFTKCRLRAADGAGKSRGRDRLPGPA
jgi:hypothetical protein